MGRDRFRADGNRGRDTAGGSFGSGPIVGMDDRQRLPGNHRFADADKKGNTGTQVDRVVDRTARTTDVDQGKTDRAAVYPLQVTVRRRIELVDRRGHRETEIGPIRLRRAEWPDADHGVSHSGRMEFSAGTPALDGLPTVRGPRA